MSNNLTPYEREVRGWSDSDLAHALDHLNTRTSDRAKFTGAQKLAVRAEASRRLRWGRHAEHNNFHEYAVEIVVRTTAANEDEAHDSIESVLRAANSTDDGIDWTFEIVGTTLVDL